MKSPLPNGSNCFQSPAVGPCLKPLVLATPQRSLIVFVGTITLMSRVDLAKAFDEAFR